MFVFLVRMESYQQEGFGKHPIGRLTWRERSLLRVFVCAQEEGRGQRKERRLSSVRQMEGVSCLVEDTEMSFI